MSTRSFRRAPRSHSLASRPKRLLFERFEQRALLAVVANDDGPYTTNEDTALNVPVPEILVARGSTWSYFDQMTNGRGTPPTLAESYPTDNAAEADDTLGVADAWNSIDFNTASSDPAIGTWKSGPAAFGKGTIDGGTVVTELEGNEASGGGGAVNTVTTYLFRSTFTISAETLASNPTFAWNVLADDGGILYIDGQEVGRVRMPAPPVDASTHANGSSENYGNETLSISDTDLVQLLENGPAVHTIAFELHQQTAADTSSDSAFDMSLTAVAMGGVLANDTIDNPTTVTTLAVTTAPGSGTVAIQTNGSFRYTPAANFNGSTTFVYTVSNGVDMDMATVTINVTPVDDRPVAVAETYATFANTPLIVDQTMPPSPTILLPQGSAWDYLDQITNGANGTPDETYPLDAEGDAWNEPDFEAATSDDAIGTWENGNGLFGFGGITCCATVTTLDGTAADYITYLFRRTLDLTPADVAAIATHGLRVRYLIDDGAVIYLDGQEVQRIQLPAAPTVIDTKTRAGTNPTEGTAVNNLLPSFFTIPPRTLTAGTHTLAVELHQAGTGSSDAGFDAQIEIPGFIGVLANDTDVENDPVTALTLVPGQGVQNGTLNLAQDGTFTYTPDADFTGPDTFQYTITANGATSAPATVTINVVPGTSTCTASPDLNGAGGVNRADLAILGQNYGRRTGATAAQGDLNCDGTVGLRDLLILRNAFSAGARSSAASAVIADAAAVDRVFSGTKARTGHATTTSVIAGTRLSGVVAPASQAHDDVTDSESASGGLRTTRAARSSRSTARRGIPSFGDVA